MNRDNDEFQHVLICQYKDLIHEAILESETDHKTKLDIGKLNSKLRVIFKAAHYDGLSDEIISNLIDQAVPDKKAA